MLAQDFVVRLHLQPLVVDNHTIKVKKDRFNHRDTQSKVECPKSKVDSPSSSLESNLQVVSFKRMQAEACTLNYLSISSQLRRLTVDVGFWTLDLSDFRVLFFKQFRQTLTLEHIQTAQHFRK